MFTKLDAQIKLFRKINLSGFNEDAFQYRKQKDLSNRSVLNCVEWELKVKQDLWKIKEPEKNEIKGKEEGKREREREREREDKPRIKRKRRIYIFVQRVRSHVQCCVHWIKLHLTAGWLITCIYASQDPPTKYQSDSINSGSKNREMFPLSWISLLRALIPAVAPTKLISAFVILLPVDYNIDDLSYSDGDGWKAKVYPTAKQSRDLCTRRKLVCRVLGHSVLAL